MKITPSVPTPLPRIARFEKLAYGMFLHWGLYSQLGRGEWVQNQEKIPVSDYANLQKTFTAADFDAPSIARLAKESGMRYITLTTRHHEGFSLYDTRGLSDFDAPHSPAARDLVAEFVEACRTEDLVPFFYHTTLDWRWDSAQCEEAKFAEYLDYLEASVEVLCRNYGEIGGLWFDGNWSRTESDWKEDRLYAMIRRYQPEAMIINNTGLGAQGILGHPEIDSTTFEQSLPIAPDRTNWPKYVSGEMCQTMNTHWGIGSHDFAYLSPGQIIENLCACRRVGANYLLNVGPTAQGAIPAYEKATLLRSGEWLQASGADQILRVGHPVPETSCPGRDFVLAANGRFYYFAYDLARTGDGHVVLVGGGESSRRIAGLQKTVRSAHWLDAPTGSLGISQDPITGETILDCTGYPYGSNLVVRIAELEC